MAEATHVGVHPSVQSISEPSRWRSFVFLVRLSVPLDALLLGEPLPRTPQPRLTHLISCSPAALAGARAWFGVLGWQRPA